MICVTLLFLKFANFVTDVNDNLAQPSLKGFYLSAQGNALGLRTSPHLTP